MKTLIRTLASASLAALCLSVSAAPEVQVDISKFMFGPKEITVAPGTTVHWTNHDETPHTVTSQGDKKLFDSKAMDTNDRYQYTFGAEGDYAYVCTVHPFMVGTVHVRKP